MDVYLSGLSCGRSRSYFNGLCERGLVTVNQKQVSKSYKVCNGDVVQFEIEDTVVNNVEAEDIPLDILFEDENIIAVNKPQGMVVHPAPGSPNATFVNGLLFHLGTGAQQLIDSVKVSTLGIAQGGNEDKEDDDDDKVALDLPETPEAAAAVAASLRPGVVHRLDKGTSGVLIAGKNPEAVSKLSQLFAAREVRKVYLTVCVGNPGEATINRAIGRHQKNRQLMTAVDNDSNGKFALSHVRTIAFDGKLSAALVRIETGRTHQIRVHLKERRTPVVGDAAYGNADWNRRLLKTGEADRPLLHAYETEFVHPFTGETVLLQAPIPPDMMAILGKLEAPGITRKDMQVIDRERCLLEGHISTAFKCDEADHVSRAPTGVTGQGFVPEERVAFEELHWTEQELPDVHWKDVDSKTKRI
jgi:23S rRNA pseudouridine1911/1915/1917 synthase